MKMKLFNAMIAVFLGVCSASAVPIYLKADATGTGDGSSWANACTDIASAVGKLATESDDRQVIYAAQGVYVVSATITALKNFELYGGFKGDETGTEEEMLAARDWDVYQTIFTGDKGGNDTWVHIVPDESDLSKPQYVPTEEPVIKDGKVNLPAYTGDYDAYVIPKPAKDSHVNCTFKLPTACGVTVIDGIWSTSFYGDDGQNGSFITDGYSYNKVAAELHVRNCRVVGHRAGRNSNNYSGFYFGYCNRTVNELTNCRFVNSSQQGPASMYGGVKYKGCEFTGIVSMARDSETATGGQGLGFISWNGGTVSDCLFSRCICYAAKELMMFGGGTDANGQSAVHQSSAFINNFGVSTVADGMTLAQIERGFVTNCCFRGNRMYLTGAVAGKSYALLRCAGNQVWSCSGVQDTTFESNKLVAVLAAEPGEGEYSLAIASHKADGGKPMMFYGCSFLQNEIVAASGGGVTAIPSDAIVQVGLNGGREPEIELGNCTVLSRGDAGVYSVAQIGDCLEANNAKLNLVNCLFMSEADFFDPFRFTQPQLVKLQNCSAKNVLVPPAGATVTGWTSDEVPLERFTIQNAMFEQSACRIAALPPGVTRSSDCYPNKLGYYGNGSYSYKYRDAGESSWSFFCPIYGAADTYGTKFSTAVPTKDVELTTRSFGAYNRGAIQAPTAAATSGKTLTLRRDPLKSGCFTSGGAVQAVAAGGAVTATVEALEGKTFDGWYDDDGNLYSSDAVLAIDALNDDLVLTARFTAPKVKLTFDLGKYGAFVESGESVYEVEAYPGAVFPTIPACEDTAEWHMLAWDKTLPAEVPESATAYTMTGITKSTRFVRVVPEEEAGDTQDGMSWETAYGSFAAAYADAAQYRGEVWMKAGAYAVDADITLRSRVIVRGGFAGNETTSAEADPTVNVTTFVPGKNTRCFRNNVDQDQIVETGLDGLVFEGFTGGAVYVGTTSDDPFVVTRCRFVRCLQSNAPGVLRILNRPAVVTDTVFEGCYCACQVQSETTSHVFAFTNTVFRRNRGENYGSSLYYGPASDYNGLYLNKARLILSGCEFNSNTGTVNNCNGSPALTVYVSGNSAKIYDTKFVANYVGGSCLGVVIYPMGSAHFRRCLFESNIVASTTARAGVLGQSAGTCYDSYFGGNRATAVGSVQSGIVSVGGYNQFLNCTFERNECRIAEGATGSASTFVWTGRNSGAGFVNCLVADNILPAGVPEIEFRDGDSANHENSPCWFINSIVQGSGADYVPFRFSAYPLRAAIVDSVIQNCELEDFLSTFCAVNLETDRVELSPTRQGDNGAKARAIGDMKHNTGINTWVSESKSLQYVLVPGISGYRALDNTGINWSVTLPDDAKLADTDAFNVSRKPNRRTWGPLQKIPGLTLLVR